jgi:ACR3 family arsenite transporter
MLFVTFLQVPLVDLSRAFARGRFMLVLVSTNFVFLPLLVTILMQLLPSDPLVRLGVLLVLVTPCIDYVVTFSHLGKADSHLLLAATPMLLVLQMLLLPVYLHLLLGNDVATLVRPGPFINAFVWLIAIPLILAGLVQLWAARSQAGQRTSTILSFMPVPATALVLFIIVAAVLPQINPNIVLGVIPFYIVFSVIAPIVGWSISRLSRLDARAGRAIAFSAGTRNSLVVLPLGLSVPSGISILPAIIVTQTLIELISELFYIKLIAKLGD